MFFKALQIQMVLNLKNHFLKLIAFEELKPQVRLTSEWYYFTKFTRIKIQF